MKNTIILLISICAVVKMQAQNINWANLQPEEKHIVNINTGLDYGIVFGAGYGYRLRGNMPIVLNADYSQPAGKDIFDDLKTRAGVQARLLKVGDFQFTARVHGIFRKYESQIIRMANFGSDMSGVAGYYRKRWYMAAEFGFDKAIVTKFTPTSVSREGYEGATGGWYQPATGGNFYYGLLAGVSIGKADIYVNGGKVVTQDFKMTPFLPYYGRIGVSYKF